MFTDVHTFMLIFIVVIFCQDQQSYIADLKLSKKKDNNASESKTYSVMPYIPPEVLTGKQQFTQAADI